MRPSPDYASSTGGRLPCEGETDSYAAAAWKSNSSLNPEATIWNPMGRPSLLKPQGRVIAGCPVELKGLVLRETRLEPGPRTR